VSSSELDFLRGVAPEFDFIDGLEGGSYLDGLAADGDFFEAVAEADASAATWATRQATKNTTGKHRAGSVQVLPPLKDAKAAARFAKFIVQTTKDRPPTKILKMPDPRNSNDELKLPARWPLPWPVHHFVYQAPEGAGKSSIVGELVKNGFTVVFCSKSNEQLVEQEAGFKARWPEMRIARYVSRARNLEEQLATLGVAFKPIYYKSESPYAMSAVDEPSTRQALRAALNATGLNGVDHRVLFDKLYTTHKAPKINGLETDVVMCTIAAFQAFCTAKHRPWWHALGLKSGKKRIFITDREYVDNSNPMCKTVPTIVDSDVYVPPKNDWGVSQRGIELGIEKIIVVIDDPDRTDFDFRRLIEDEHFADLHRKKAALPKYQQDWVYTDHWKSLGYPPLLCKALAKEWTDKAHAHALESFQKNIFESRPEAQYIGYSLQRGFRSKDPLAPKVLVTTTENITRKLALASLGRTMKWARGLPEKYEYWMNFEHPMDRRVSSRAHFTLLSTRLVRKGEHVLLLLIAEKLRQEFPDLAFIADGLGCDLNLSNNRGRNDLADRSTLIKLSVPNPKVAMNLWAQFPKNESPGKLNTILLGDLANQAIGRNQGNRFSSKPCIVLVDPIYATELASSGLIRYQRTPWGFQPPNVGGFMMHGPISPIEERLISLLANARSFGMGIAGMTIGFGLPDHQRAMYVDWLDRNNVAYQHVLAEPPQSR
jgi:hypothetical protein